ncbi:hypothetical protein EDB92DRAFT_2105138 [Lactarius akahatsu]|uniref:Zinc finger PHD-type domain-containing protein n=1 Tax=Lactarius akahatsu TaxID=416441 RepID=A0AAD4LGX6_9AGAM|nr:hypothetical protein EDB92DRAFT_2105138 [Lactarius akahatsu]
MPPSHTPSYLFETSTLIAFVSTLQDRLSKPQLKFIPQTEQTDLFPYRERSETVYEVWEFNTHQCPACEPPVQLDTVNGQRSGRNYQWTLKYSGIVPCPNATNFSYSAAMCPYCPDGSPAIWRYNMRLHFRLRHQGIDATRHEDLWKITAGEADAMAEIWANRHKQPKRRGKGKQKAPLKVSEAHSSCRLSGRNYSYIACEDDTVHDDELDLIEECPSGHEAWCGDGRSDAASSAPPGSDGIEDGGDGLGELGGGDERDVGDKSEPVIGAATVRHVAAESNGYAPNHNLLLSVPNVGVPALPPADVVACPTSGTTKHLTGTEDEGGGLLRGAQMSSFGRKRKLRNMCDVSACLCGKSATPSAVQTAGDEVVCCRVVGCETKWYHTTCVGLSFSPKNWTCEVCQSDMGMLKRRLTVTPLSTPLSKTGKIVPKAPRAPA